jgi:hypothetical protein
MPGAHDPRPGGAIPKLICALALGVAWPTPLGATPYDYIAVGDPVEAELRILDLFSSDSLNGRLRLPRLGTRPLQPLELEGPGAPPAAPAAPIAIALARVERALGRDRGPGFAPHPMYTSTPRLLDLDAEQQRFQLSAGFEGLGEVNRGREARLVSGSGFHGRLSMGLDRLVVYSHYIVGRIDEARGFADPILPDNDLIVLPEDTYLGYTEEQGRWGAQFGRSRWHWGPGEEGSLVLSKTSPMLTGLAFRARVSSLHADAIALSATLKQSSGEQLAAHRIEWQPTDRLRLGVTESARYRSPGWKPLYLMGAIPYVLVQRLERQNETDSLLAVRNNILTAFDVTCRVADGTRFYGEFLIDDLAVRSGRLPNKLAWQLGWEGAGAIGPSRISWGGEFTRITRYVYTSFFGRDYAVQGRSLGFPVAPDVRRLRLRAAWDPNPDWQVSLRATHSDKGENRLDEPFRPGTPRVNSSIFEGIAETTRDAELGARWWPASGVNLAVSGGYSWVDNADHVMHAKRNSAHGAIEFKLSR